MQPDGEEPLPDTHISMAQHTKIRKWKRSLSENKVSQIRMTSGRRNS